MERIGKKNKNPRPYGEGFCNADKEGSRYGKSGRGHLFMCWPDL